MAIRSLTGFRLARNFTRGAIGCGCLAAVLLAAGCGTSEPKDTRAADEATLRSLDAQWAKSAAAKDVDAAVGYYSDDASLLAPNEPIASDKASIRAAWSAMLSPDTTLNWQASKVEVARSGDLAYILGVYQLTTTDPKAKPMADRGKFVEVWKKQADGSWKTVADIFNSDLAVQTPKPAPTAAKKAGRRHGKRKAHGSRST
jgi:ketosteroid isomerase-like protein